MKALLPKLPRPDGPSADVRRLLGRLALGWAFVAVALAMFDDVPADVPAWALHHTIVYRALVAAALFLLGLLFLNVVALVFHGWLFTGFAVGPAQGSSELVADQQESGALEDTIRALKKVASGADEISRDFDERLSAVEQACGIDPPDTPPTSLLVLLEAADDDELEGDGAAGGEGQQSP